MPPPIPTATYRLQLSRDFGFDDAAALIPYLKDLGISHLYASPFLKARAGSTHGYDIVDHNSLNPEFGGEAAFERLQNALAENDLGLILDFVPNHMAVGNADNPWWLDVLEWGRKSPYADFFDIAWDLLPYHRGGGVLLPVLGRPYGEALVGGELQLKYDAAGGRFSVWYFNHRFPINPQRYSDILTTVVQGADAGTQSEGRVLLELADKHRAPGTPDYEGSLRFKHDLSRADGVDAIIERGLTAYAPDSESGVRLLHRLLERQHYRLAFWRLAPSSINYRRFFDVNDLAGLRMEDPGTFAQTHRLVARLIADGKLHGLRLDHIDGLFDPAQYARRLQQLISKARGRTRNPFYVVVEKILEDGETMPALPGISGTTGYEWLNTISRFLLDEEGRRSLETLWARIAPGGSDFNIVLRQSKFRILDTIMASEFNVLAQLLGRIAAGHYNTRDYAPDRLRDALRLYVVGFPIYRTYVTPAACSAADRAVIERTIAGARREWAGPDRDIFEFLRGVITLDLARDGLPYSRSRLRQFAMKLQQFTGPMMAKAMEDTALYRHHALLALNEVGGHPALPGLGVDEFHRRMIERSERSPHGMTATSTHDTKRGEDARARILALSEIPDLWESHVLRWRELNEPFLSESGGRRCPTPAHEYMLYQALIGVWPHRTPTEEFINRLEGYAIKAAREGKQETSWIDPEESYEAGLRGFVRSILAPEHRGFFGSFDSFARRTTLLGALNSFNQLLLKATIPGVPDFYQGSEVWDLSLVDPDNRRPIDFSSLRSAPPVQGSGATIAEYVDPGAKLALTHKLLKLRAEHNILFRDGAYVPVDVSGPERNHVLAFMRVHRTARILVVAGRQYSGITSGGLHPPSRLWNAELPPGIGTVRPLIPLTADTDRPAGISGIPLGVFSCE